MNAIVSALVAVFTQRYAQVLLVLLYVVGAALWIVGSDVGFSLLLDDASQLALAGALKGCLFVGVTALLLLTLASEELVLVTMLPLAFGLWWTLGLMGWLGLPIDLMNSIFVIFVIFERRVSRSVDADSHGGRNICRRG